MKIVNASRTADFNGSIRNYYDLYDVRILDVTSYAKEEKWHKHNKLTEILFLISGKIIAHTKDKTEEILPNQIVVFEPGEEHRIDPQYLRSRILGIKYIKGDVNLESLLISDWEGWI